MEQCNICLKQKDKIKYTTDRISICQPCEKLLISTLIENDQIKADLLRVARALLLPPPPKPIIVEHINYVEKAKRKLFGSEGIISLLMGSVFDSTNRQLQINALAKELRDTKLKQNQNELAKHERELLAYNGDIKRMIDTNMMHSQILSVMPEGVYPASIISICYKAGFRPETCRNDKLRMHQT